MPFSVGPPTPTLSFFRDPSLIAKITTNLSKMQKKIAQKNALNGNSQQKSCHSLQEDATTNKVVKLSQQNIKPIGN